MRGVAEVATVGGFEPQYQVNVDPCGCRHTESRSAAVVDAVRGGNTEAGGRLIEFGGSEYMVRGRGYVKSAHDFEKIVVAGRRERRADPGAGYRPGDPRARPAPRRLRPRRRGEAVRGIVVMRQGENALDVIERVKAKMRRSSPACRRA